MIKTKLKIHLNFFGESWVGDDDFELDGLSQSGDMVQYDNSIQEQNSKNILTINLIESVMSTYGWIKYLDINIKGTNNHIVKHHNKNSTNFAITENRLIIVDRQIVKSLNYKTIFCNHFGVILAHCTNETELTNLLEILK